MKYIYLNMDLDRIEAITIVPSCLYDTFRMVEAEDFLVEKLATKSATLILQELGSINAANARTKRNKLLQDCDWTQVADAPVDKIAWQSYRQALRDITEQAGFPLEIEWPVKP